MADFCAPCTDENFGPDLENDFSHVEYPQWALCEGCGYHVILPGGKRAHDELVETRFLEPCPKCVAIVRQWYKTSSRGLVRSLAT